MYVKMGNMTDGEQLLDTTNITRVSKEEESDDSSCLKEQDELSSLGARVSPWTEQLAREYGLALDEKGVIVEEVIPDGRAAGAGLLEGDLIRAVNQEPTPDLESFFNALQDKGTALLDVLRREVSVYLVIPEEEEKPLCKRLKDDG